MGFQVGSQGMNRFIPSNINLKNIFLRFDCQYKEKSNGVTLVSCEMIVLEHQWDKIFKFTKKNNDHWYEIRHVIECLISDPIDENVIQAKESQWKLSR